MNTSNFVTLLGRLGAAPVRKTLPNGNSLLEFSLATNNSYKDRDGNRVTKTDWHRVKAFGPVVDTLERYLSKGDQLSVVGALRYNEWTDKHDQKRKSAEVILNAFSFVGSRNSEDAPAPAATTKLKATYAGKLNNAVALETAAATDLPF